MKPATDEQLAELRRIIISANHPNVTDFGKKAMLFALAESKNLTLGIDLVLIELDKKLGFEIRNTIHQMISSGFSTQINEKMEKLGIRFYFNTDFFGASPHGCFILCHRARLFPRLYKNEVKEARQVEVKVITVAAPIKIEASAFESFQKIEEISLES